MNRALLVVLVLFFSILAAGCDESTEGVQAERPASVQAETITETATVPFEEVTKEDPNLPRGQNEIQQEGRAGEKEVTYEIRDGERHSVAEKTITKPQSQITAVGTMVQPIELSGTGQQASEKFVLEEGLSVFKMTHSGGSNFAIELLDGSGDTIELLVNEIGSFQGSKAVRIDDDGEFIMDISANGPWTVKIDQPRPKSAPKAPRTLTGKGQTASEFVQLESGLTTFKMKHSGSSNFAIVLLDEEGDSVELLVNEIGKFDGSRAIGVPYSGIYIMDIAADGDWAVSID